jgi:poly-gamma-glutamate capsule biosynthesis protein CapA/YwtB (metallophosphatase superfamily)
MNIALTGDVMLGRMVSETIIESPFLPLTTVWGDVLPLLLKADLRLINLECVISRTGQEWRPQEKAFHFRADPRTIDVLRAARIDCVTLANNHILDYGPDALLECLSLLRQGDIHHTGAGRNLEEALRPAIIDCEGNRFAIVALTDNEPEWEASEQQPGVNVIRYDEGGLLEPYRTRLCQAIQHARQEAQFIIISAHVGPNWGRPSQAIRTLAHQLLDFGGDLYWGHSNHAPQGIEVYEGKAILYSTGDFIDDYAVDRTERNDLSFLYLLQWDHHHLESLHFYPVRIEACRVQLAHDRDATFLARRMQTQCEAFGRIPEFQNDVGTLALRSG